MIPDADLLIERIPLKRPGGQYVGCPLPEIKVTHLPTGNYVVVRSENSALKSRNLAIKMLEWMEACIATNDYY